MNLQTITTIELSSICNLACKYCINRLMYDDPARTPGIMTDDIFEKSLYWLKKLVERGTQKEVNLNGNGESLLDPKLIERARAVKDIMGNHGPVMFCTNGVLMTQDIAVKLKDAGVNRIDVSIHSPYHARRCAHILNGIGMNGVIADGAVRSSHNWAGQLEPEHSIEMCYTIPCHPIMEGRGYINSEGDLSPCCYDYRNLGKFGNVADDDLLDRPVAPFSLCASCHQVLPQPAKEIAA